MKKIITRIVLAIILLPFVLIMLFIVSQIIGAVVNTYATERQTKALRHNLEQNIDDIEIVSVYEETGNTSGTGNHVDCLSRIVFLTSLTEDEIISRLEEYYDFESWAIDFEINEDGMYQIIYTTSAPFKGNIMGH